MVDIIRFSLHIIVEDVRTYFKNNLDPIFIPDFRKELRPTGMTE